MHRSSSWLIGPLGLAALLHLGMGRAEAQAPASNATNSCIQCHKAFPGKLSDPIKKFQQDIHAEKGFSCTDCHGGDPASFDPKRSMSKEKGFVGALKPAEIPPFCDKCHGHLEFMRKYNPTMPVGQYQAYQTSIHGKRLAQGDVKVATCVSCHGAHGILPASRAASPVYRPNVAKTCAKCHADDNYMKGYKIPTNQFRDYLQSFHAETLLVKRDLAAPTCTSCHGNHGAFPPKVDSVGGMCGQCHVNNLEFFLRSPTHKGFEKLHLPDCIVCHSNHKVLRASDSMIGDKPPAVCVGCHNPGAKELVAAADMRAQIEKLKSHIQKAEQELVVAERLGMEVSESKFQMKEVHTALIKVRTRVHTFTPSEVKKEAEKGSKIAEEVYQTAFASIQDYYGRRRWVIFPIAFTLLIAGTLYLKLRRMEEDDRRDG